MERPTQLDQALELAVSTISTAENEVTVKDLHQTLESEGFDSPIRRATVRNLLGIVDIGPGWVLSMKPLDSDGNYPVPQWKLDWQKRKQQEAKQKESEAFETTL